MDAKARRLSIWRRSMGVRKKASELALLCDASMCLLHFDQEGRLRTLPDNQAQLDAVLMRYMRAGRAKQRWEAAEKVTAGNGQRVGGGPPGLGDERLDAMSPTELGELTCMLEAKVREVADRIALLNGGQSMQQKRGDTSSFSLHAGFYGDGTPCLVDDLQMGFPGDIQVEKRDAIRKAAPLYPQFYRDGTPYLPGLLQMTNTEN